MNWKLICSVLAVFSHTVAMFLFAYGYFSVGEKLMRNTKTKKMMPMGDPALPQEMDAVKDFCRDQPRPKPFEKFVFIVIDALRADFIPTVRNNSRLYSEVMMPYVEKLLRDGQAMGMVSEAETPTVTMPRIKALLSGIRPNFLDLVLNFKAARFGEDNLIDRAVKKGKRLIFYGDDTWLNMFDSRIFVRVNSTSSFFAPDYTTVDTNVTENLMPELEKMSEWDFLILHYLGVDHIGHSHGGARSHLIPEKLLEMDRVIEMVHTTLKRHNSHALMVVTGDHGMTDDGNHGGSTVEEADTAMIFLSADDNLESMPRDGRLAKTVKQVDLVSTLSALLDLRIPERNVGKPMVAVLRYFGYTDAVIACHLRENLMQMCNISKTGCSSQELSYLQELHKLAIASPGEPVHLRKLINLYIKRIESLQTVSSELFYRTVSATLLGLGLSWSSLCALVVLHWDLHEVKRLLSDSFAVVLIFAFLFGVILQSSTSFIENEGDYWHYITSSLLLLVFLRALLFSKKNLADSTESVAVGSLNNRTKSMQIVKYLFALLLQRIIMSWNSADSPIAVLCRTKGTIHYVSAITISSLTMVAFLLSAKEFSTEQAIFICGLFWTYLYKSDLGYLAPLNFFGFKSSSLAFISPTCKARVVYVHIALIVGNMLIRKYKTSIPFLNSKVMKTVSSRKTKISNFLRALRLSWALLCLLLAKISNVPLIAMNILLEELVYSSTLQLGVREPQICLTLLYTIHGLNGFYAMGNSNSLSSINVEAGFVGINNDDPFLFVCLLTGFSICSMHIYWFIMLLVRSEQLLKISNKQKFLKSFSISATLMIFVRLSTVNFYQTIAFILRNHIFIWTVICPKFLYEGFFTLLTNALVCCTLICFYMMQNK